MIIKKNTGSGAITILDKHIFADSTARDAYFVLHPTELVDGLMIQVGTDFEKYQASMTTFNNITAVVKGDAATIQAGTVTMLASGSPATVTNSGTTSSAVFNFGLPNTDISSKQDVLVSGTNIKTINGTSILGSGNMVISGGTGAVDSVNTKTGTVTLNQDEIPDGTTYKQYSATEKTKLSGIATGAQVNTSKVKASATDTTEGYLGDKIVAGENVTVTKNNSGGNETYTIASTGGSGGGVTVYADLTTLKAIIPTNGSLCVLDSKLYIYNSSSTQYPDDLFVIRPTSSTDKGRWELESTKSGYKKVPINYEIVPIDEGVSNSFNYTDNKLKISLSTTYKNGILTEKNGKFDGDAKLFNFKLPIGLGASPMLALKYNGSENKQGGSLQGFSVLMTGSGELRVINDQTATYYPVVSTRTSEWLYGEDEYSGTVKLYENRISIVLSNEKNLKCYNSTYQDLPAILANINIKNGFTQINNGPLIFEDITARDIVSYTNLVMMGDSNTYGHGLPDRCESSSDKLRYKTMKNAVDVSNTGICGATIPVLNSLVNTDIPAWVQANSYTQNDLVTYTDGKVYRANQTVLAGTAWSLTNFVIQGESGARLSSYINANLENVAYVNIGINDVGYNDYTPAQAYANLETLIQNLKTAGFAKVGIATIPYLGTGQADYATINPKVLAYNTLVLANTTADFIADINLESTNTLNTLPYNWAIQSDGLHYTSALNEIISNKIIDSLKLYNI